NVFHNLNAVPAGTLLNVPNNTSVNYDHYRPLSYYQDINIGTPDVYSNYNAMQASYKHQRGRFDYLFNYTFSKAMGLNQGTGGSGVGGAGTFDRLNKAQNYGPLPFDRRHIFNAAYSFQLGNPIRDGMLLKGLANGWQISGITQWQSGANLQLNTGGGNFS